MNKSKWVITNKRSEASPLIGMEPLFRTMSEYTANALNSDLETEFMIEFSNGTASMAAIENDWKEFGEHTVEMLKKEEFFSWLINGLSAETIHLNDIGSLLRSLSFSELSNSELIRYLESSFSKLLEFFKYNHIVNSSDFYHDQLTKHLYTILNNYNFQCENAGVSIGNAYSILTTPDKEVWIQEQEHDLFRLSSNLLAEDLINSEQVLNEYLDEFTEKYFWVEYEQQGSELHKEDFLIKLREFIGLNKNPVDELDKLILRRNQMKVKRRELESELQLSHNDSYIFHVARMLVYWKLHLREVKVRFYCCMNNLLEECSKRLFISFEEVRFLTQKELMGYLYTNTFPNRNDLNERLNHCVLKFTNNETIIFTGNEAKSCFSKLNGLVTANNQTTISGFCGYPGLVEGYVSKVLTLNDVGGFREGDILTAYMTDISIVPAMKRAKAIITDVGGVTCHAAIIAREFKIPCVIGTKQVTNLFQNGDYVHVDADNGKVNLIQKSITDRALIKSEEEFREKEIEVNITLSNSIRTKVNSITCISNVTSLTKNIFGGKAESLAFLINNGFPTPNGIVLSTSEFDCFIIKNNLVDKINSILNSVNLYSELEGVSHNIRQLIINGEFDQNLADKLYSEFDSLNLSKVAIRSSAPTEDSLEASWAGQFDSYLNISRDELIETIKSCWASCFSSRSLSYRSSLGANNLNLSLAVVIQEMIHSRVSGTAFSVNPVNNKNSELIIESCIGLGESLVSGNITPITYIVRKSDRKIIEERFEFQETAIFSENSMSGVKKKTLNRKNQCSQSMTDEIFNSLVDLILTIENKSNAPVDIEWAFDGQKVHIVQSRPITTL